MIVPKSEEEAVVETTGPTETTGVLSVDILAQINLQSEYSALNEPLQFRASKTCNRFRWCGCTTCSPI